VKRFQNLKSYLGLSAVAAIFVGILVYGGIRLVESALIAALVTFIVSVLIIATLDLSFKADEEDPNKPRLS
jgi:TRAP-type C4-dicarboxylate transport system permease large subunit